ncbi:MAG: TIGR03643 family protein [Bacteroidota bacterium]
MSDSEFDYCYYSGLPSPMAYMEVEPVKSNKSMTVIDLNRIIEMAWEDRTPFEAIKFQFALSESEVKTLMKKQLKAGSYIAWRKRVENCATKHAKLRSNKISRFKSNQQRTISGNKISKK